MTNRQANSYTNGDADSRADSYTDIFNYRGAAYNAAMQKYPDAREAERLQLISLLTLKNAEHICDMPAGGGYLADGIAKALAAKPTNTQTSPQPNICCIEPSRVFSQSIRADYEILNQPLQAIDKPDASFSVIASLAGLHHVEDRQGIFNEWARLLQKNGQLAVADVGTGSGTGQFLNEFVDQHTPNGHQGWFFNDGEFSQLSANSGLTNITEQLRDVPWRFNNQQEMANFCAQLFYLPEVSHSLLIEALSDLIGISKTKDHTGVYLNLNWQLRYASANKAPA